MAFPWLGCQLFQTRSCQVAVTSIVGHCCLVQCCIDVSFRCIEISMKEGYLPAEVNLSFESGWIAAAESTKSSHIPTSLCWIWKTLKNPGLLCCIWRYSGESLQRLLGFQVPRLGNLHADGGTHLGEKTKTKQQIHQKFRRNFWIRFVSTLYIFLLCFLGFCSMHVFRDQSQTPPGFCHRKNTWLNNFSWTAASLQSITIFTTCTWNRSALRSNFGWQPNPCTPPTRMSLHICADPTRTSGRRETRRQHHEGASAAAQVHQHVIRTQVPQSLQHGGDVLWSRISRRMTCGM